MLDRIRRWLGAERTDLSWPDLSRALDLAPDPDGQTRLSGRRDGHQVSLRATSERRLDDEFATVFVNVTFARPLPVEFSIGASRGTDQRAGSGDWPPLRTGDAGFDAVARASSPDPEGLREWLTPERRSAIGGLLRSAPTCLLDRTSLVQTRALEGLATTDLVGEVEHLLRVASVLVPPR